MAGFDPSLDKSLWSESVNIDGMFNLKVSVMSYNDGTPKMQISRERVNKEGMTSFAKLGRMTLDEIKAITPLIQKATEWMEENKSAEEAE